MSENLSPIGFWSYARQDDEEKLSGLRSILKRQLQQKYGNEPVQIFQDVAAIPPGADWEHQIREALNHSTFLIPIITPSFLESRWCNEEFFIFLERERSLAQTFPELAGAKRIFPILYVDIKDVEAYNPKLLDELNKRQKTEFRDLIYENLSDKTLLLRLDKIAESLRELLRRDQRAIRERNSATAAASQISVQQAANQKQAEKEAAAHKAAADQTTHDAEAQHQKEIPETREPEEANAPPAPPPPRKIWSITSSTLAYMVPLSVLGLAAIFFVSFRQHDRGSAPTPGAVSFGAYQATPQNSPAKDNEATAAKPTQDPAPRTISTDHDGGTRATEPHAAPPPPPPPPPAPLAAAQSPASLFKQARRPYDAGRFKEAAPLMASACNAGSPDGCNNLGFMYERGKGVTADNVQAVALYRKACDGGNAIACGNLGFMYDQGKGVTADNAQAVALFRKACDGGDARGCNNLGAMYEDGTGVTADNVQAVALYRKACDGGNAVGCSNLKRLQP